MSKLKSGDMICCIDNKGAEKLLKIGDYYKVWDVHRYELGFPEIVFLWRVRGYFSPDRFEVCRGTT